MRVVRHVQPRGGAALEMRICAEPMIPTYRKVVRTPRIRLVTMKGPSLRPLPTLARKVPTKGPQLIHPPQ